ncbi:MAG: hypothetical protein DMF49_02580 [Acidobacteria bacterium]|nr:MAG: hypothetical protein DMF49_02580 [Acidobacteriota bacterium]
MDPMSCELARDRLGARGGEFPPPAGNAFLAHLSNCASCRDEAVRIDPALLFALAAREAPQPDWTGFNSRLRVAIEQQDRETGLFGRLLDAGVLAPKRLAPTLALAAVFALAFVLSWQVAARWTPGLPGLAQHAAGARPAPAARIASGRTGEAARSQVHPSRGPTPAPVESVASPTARVVHMRIGDDAEAGAGVEPSDLVLILDEGMDL